MTGKVEYLERYSVAPSPSRDYYGLKILRDEVILYIWKISHGPHKTPILRRCKFFEFDRDKTLQDDISRTFGDHFVNYVKSIARGQGNTLLTLPRSSIERIVAHLKLKDIVNLSTLSRIANVVFNDNLVWEALYRRHERFNIGRGEREYAMAYGWKRAFKDKQMVLSVEHRKTPSSTMKREKTKPESTRAMKDASKVPNSSTNGLTTKSIQISERTVPTNVIKSLKDPDVDYNAKSIKMDKKMNANVKQIANAKSRRAENPRSLKNEKSNVRLVESKHDIREVFSDSMTATRKIANTQRAKLRKSSISTKIGNTNVKISDKSKIGDSKCKTPDDQTKSKSKMKSTTKKLTQTKSAILNSNESFLNESGSVLANENFELAYLIEESLKRLRSPRTVFDYDFSYLDGSKTLVNAARKSDDTRKPGKTIDNTSKSNDRSNTRLDRLSEYSDSFGTPSTGSMIEHNKQDFEEKKSKRSDDSKVSTNRSERRSLDFYEASLSKSPKALLQTSDIKRYIPRGTLNGIDIMKSLRSVNPATTTSGKSLSTSVKNRFALKKTKDRITDKKNRPDAIFL